MEIASSLDEPAGVDIMTDFHQRRDPDEPVAVTPEN